MYCYDALPSSNSYHLQDERSARRSDSVPAAREDVWERRPDRDTLDVTRRTHRLDDGGGGYHQILEIEPIRSRHPIRLLFINAEKGVLTDEREPATLGLLRPLRETLNRILTS